MRSEDDRSQARERALTLLYEAQSKGITPGEALDSLPVRPDELTTRIVRGVDERHERFDALIATHSKN